MQTLITTDEMEADFTTSNFRFFRPSAFEPGAPPEVVKFGIMVKQFLGVDFSRKSFYLDLVLTLKWKDSNATNVVDEVGLPAADHAVLLSHDAAQRMWLPHVAVTNHDIKGLEVVSSNIRVHRDGSVVQVERFLARIPQAFDVSLFPFDAQTLRVKVASTTLMSDDVVLEPMLPQSQLPASNLFKNLSAPAALDEANVTGIASSLFEGMEYALVDSGLQSYEEITGPIHKSRGEFSFRVKRLYKEYVQSIFLPACLLVGISWTVFFFPLEEPFIMPRVATSALAFLAFLTLAYRVDLQIPARSGLAWIDIFMESTEILTFATIALNITEIYIFHQMSMPVLARRLSAELQRFFFFLALTTDAIVFSSAEERKLAGAQLLVRTLLVVSVVGYIATAFWRMHAERLSAGKG